MAEFALVLPVVLMGFIVMADFGRIFAAMITLESATRPCRRGCREPVRRGSPGRTRMRRHRPANYYDALHSKAAQVVCNDMRGQPNTNYDGATNTCPDMPLVMVCVHDSQDTGCSSLASPGSPAPPAQCTVFNPPPDNGQGAAVHPPSRPRWVEVRTCYKFTAILN